LDEVQAFPLICLRHLGAQQPFAPIDRLIAAGSA